MVNKKLVKDSELKSFGSVENFAEKTKTLLNYQKEHWSLLNTGYNNLELVETREIFINDTKIILKYDSQKETNSEKQVNDAEKCPFCQNNLPEVNKGIQYGNDLLILANPVPIFQEQLIITKTKHTQHRIKKGFEDLLNLSRDLGKYFTLFYNGPDSGAPDTNHLHFQACSKITFPIINEYKSMGKNFSRQIGKNGKMEVLASKNFVRKFILLESTSKIELLNIFKIFYDGYLRISGNSIEPIMNIISSFENNKWQIFIFPRKKERHDFYLKKREEQSLVVPTASDFGGICIPQRKEDYKNITNESLEAIFNEVSVSTEFFEFLINRCEFYFK